MYLTTIVLMDVAVLTVSLDLFQNRRHIFRSSLSTQQIKVTCCDVYTCLKFHVCCGVITAELYALFMVSVQMFLRP